MFITAPPTLRHLTCAAKTTALMCGLLTLAACAKPIQPPKPIAATPMLQNGSEARLSSEFERLSPNGIATALPQAVDASLDIPKISDYLTHCSAAFKQRHADFIDKYDRLPLIPLYSEDTGDIADFINTSFANETLSCQLAAIDYAELVSKKKIVYDQLWLQNDYVGHETGLKRHIAKVQVDLFNLYARQGLLREGDAALNYAKEAHALWQQWATTPLDYQTPAALETTLLATMTMQLAFNDLLNYMQTHAQLLNKKPYKKAIVIDQALIYLAELNARYAALTEQINAQATSAQWRKALLNTEGQTLNDHEAQAAIAASIAELNKRSHDTMVHFFDLAKLRYQGYQDQGYQGFDKAQMLESAKTFLIQDADQLPLGQLLVALDYAQLNDKASSVRWLDKVADDTVLMGQLCGLDDGAVSEGDANKTAFSQTAILSNVTNANWLQQQLKQRCQ